MKKPQKKKKILFIPYPKSTFQKKDFKLLLESFDVTPIKWNGKRSIPKIMINVFKSDIIYAWFAGDHAAVAVFFSKLFRKKSVVIVGGYDVAYVPDLNYGAFTLSCHKKILSRFALKNANLVLVVDPSLKKDAIINAKISGNNIYYIPTGHDSDYWKPKGPKENIILTVAGASNIQRIKLKGFDTFVKSAKYVKEAKFVVVSVRGEAKEYLEKIASENVELYEFLPSDKLLKYYQKAKIYCQLSLREGLPTALCEAMLCECIPVGTRIDGIKTAIGDTGFYVDYGNDKSTAETIKKALYSKEDLGKKARERIKTHFPDQRRRKELNKIILELM